MSHLKVYIIIVNYRKWEDTRDCIESVLRSGYNHFSILVIDNHSMNNSLESLADWYAQTASAGMSGDDISYKLIEKHELESIVISSLPKILFIQNDINSGFAAGNNLALRLLLQEDAYTWLLNPDMVVKTGAMSALLTFAREKNAVIGANSIIGAEVRSFKGNHDLLFYGGGKVNFRFATVRMIDDRKDIEKLDYISGASLFTHTESFRRYGLLPEDYFLYWEETDWCYRARQNGARLYVCTEAVCYDKISSVIGNSFMAHYYYARNGLLFISKFCRKNIPVVLFFMGTRLLKRLITGQWNRARGMFRGTVDFLKRK